MGSLRINAVWVITWVLYVFRNVSKAAGPPTNCSTKKQVCSVLFIFSVEWCSVLRSHFVCVIQIMYCIMPSLISGFSFAEEDKINDEGNNCVEKEINTDPWPGYRFTGKLRPHYPLVRTHEYSTHTLSLNKTNVCIQTFSFISFSWLC